MTYKLLKGGKLVLDTLMISQVNVCILSINAVKWNSLIKALGRCFFSLNMLLYEITEGNAAVVPILKKKKSLISHK